MKFIKIFIAACLILTGCEQKSLEPGQSVPVFMVDYPYPTADKPQSKLWYMDGSWWGILPRSTGPSLWQRTDAGWKEHSEIGASLKGIPGRVDVWAEENEITAVGVEDSMVVFRLRKRNNKSGIVHWQARILQVLYPPVESEKTETATIAKDDTGSWWVAADDGVNIYVWTSGDGGENWEGPIMLAQGIDKDDICTIANIHEGVIMIWSDQSEEAVKARIHKNGKVPEDWEEETIVEAGNKTADDHLNTAFSQDGTLWLATKNSIDKIGQPQFVLRIRTPAGLWRNYPYSNLDSVEHPSRPAIFSTAGNPPLILSGHSVYNYINRYLDKIEFGLVDTLNPEILENKIAVISPDTTGWSGINSINNITGPKAPFPEGVPWIILASDREGRVYEADLAKYFGKNKNQ